MRQRGGNDQRFTWRRRWHGFNTPAHFLCQTKGRNLVLLFCMHYVADLSDLTFDDTDPFWFPTLAGGLAISAGQRSRWSFSRNFSEKDPNPLVAQRIGYPDRLGWYSVSMLTSTIFSALIGTALGFLAGLGIGGGSLLILWLSTVIGMDHITARGINLLFFIPAACIACLFRWRQGNLDLPTILPAAISGCVFALLGSWISTIIDTALLKQLLGILLVATGIRELFYRPRKAK